ncbi:lysylphosphatidylglycerol synthase domain-containing protein [Pseudomonas sp. GCM10022186]|uniref:lysylphosphatidylglycerol synthase domain-containing protein n=1 Tax=Pseudomonas sp. GCM10022186 TaxID=3252650 RepID=UPI0036232A69
MTDHPKKPWMKWGMHLLTLFFVLLVPTLLYLLAKNLDWNEVQQSLRAYGAVTLLVGAALAFSSYLVFSIFDLVARVYTGHHLPARQVIPVAFVCYAFNLNFTTWVGGVALRYRLYKRLGLDTGTVTRIISLGILTNWIGYMALAGVVFSLRLVKLPENWNLGVTGLQMIGFLLLAVATLYLFACGYAKRRTWSWRDHEITLPSLRLALIQIWLGATNWALMASLIFWLLPHGHGTYYASILGILLISCVAGVITHIPAGLGVLETVFLALLHDQMSQGSLVAALLGYRTLYFLLPLLVAVVVYLVLEKRAKTIRRRHKHRVKPESRKSSTG